MSDERTTVAELRARIADFVAQREWQPFHDPKNLAMAIAVEAAELMEHFQWARSEQLAELVAEPGLRSQVTDELADVLAFVLALANVLDIDLSDALRAKMVKNAAKYPADAVRGTYRKPPRADA